MTPTYPQTSTMNKAFLPILAILMMLTAAVPAATAAPGNVQVKATLDSAYILMGKQTTLHVEIVQPRGTVGRFLNVGERLTPEVEVAATPQADTSSIGSGREEIRQSIVLQAFDSGLYTIGPLVYAAGADTVLSNALALKVIPASVDSLAAIHDYAGVASPRTRLWDYLPDFVADYWWVMLLLGLAALGMAAYILWRRKNSLLGAVLPKKKPVPPYELAMRRLSQLKEEKLCESGREKEFYTRLTEILRVYLDSRFGINAMEMTSTQIMHNVSVNTETKPSAKLMKSILEMADFVKFAKVRPLPDDNARTFAMALQFVEATKPAPEPEAEAGPQAPQKPQTPPVPPIPSTDKSSK